MRKILVLLLVCLVAGGCRTSRVSVPPTTITLNNRDSVRTEYIETVRLDTLYVEVGVPMESVRQTVGDGRSHLETGFAESDAWINPDGTLGHTLDNKPRKMEAPVVVPVKETRSNTSSDSVREVPVPYPVPEYVERAFTTMEKIKIKAFWILSFGLIGCLVWIFIPRIVSVIRKCY